MIVGINDYLEIKKYIYIRHFRLRVYLMITYLLMNNSVRLENRKLCCLDTNSLITISVDRERRKTKYVKSGIRCRVPWNCDVLLPSKKKPLLDLRMYWLECHYNKRLSGEQEKRKIWREGYSERQDYFVGSVALKNSLSLTDAGQTETAGFLCIVYRVHRKRSF